MHLGGHRHDHALGGRSRRPRVERLGLPRLPRTMWTTDERDGWRVAAERQWEHMLEMRAAELAPGGWFIAAIPASPAVVPGQDRASTSRSSGT